MTAEIEKRTQNSVTTLMGVSNADGVSPIRVYVDDATHAMLVSASVSIVGGAVSQADNSAYTAGTTSVNPIGAFYHSTIDTVTDGRVAALAMDSKRNLFVVLRDAAGNARGANIDANNNIGAVLAAETTKVIGTVNISAGQTIATVTTVGAVTAITNALPVGANVIGKVSIDQTTPGTTNLVALTAETTKVIGTVRNVGNIGAVLDGVITAATAPVNGVMGLGVYNSTEPSPTTGQSVGIQLDSKGRQRMVIMDAAGNTRGANVDASNRMSVIADQNGSNWSINVAQIGGTTIVNGGTAGIQSVGGATATNVALTDNPLNTGGQAVSSENAAVTTARKVQFVADLVGKQIVLPYANPENFLYGATAAIVDTTGTAIIASAGGSLRNYITQVSVFNSHATVSSVVEIRDGTATVMFRGYALAAGGGFTAMFPTPLRGTAATAVNAYVITTGSNIYVSASGYKGV